MKNLYIIYIQILYGKKYLRPLISTIDAYLNSKLYFKVRKVIDTKFQNFVVISFEITINNYYYDTIIFIFSIFIYFAQTHFRLNTFISLSDF